MNSVASATGSNAYTQALSIGVQMAVFYLTGAGITNEQAGALAILLFPYVHWLMMKAGDKNSDGVPDVMQPTGAPPPASPMKTAVILSLVMAGSLLTLSACQSLWVKPETPAQAVYRVQGDFNGMVVIANRYRDLPPCEQPQAPVLCSKAEVVQTSQKAANAAWTAIQAAQATVTTPGFGESTVQSSLTAAANAVKAFGEIAKQLRIE